MIGYTPCSTQCVSHFLHTMSFHSPFKWIVQVDRERRLIYTHPCDSHLSVTTLLILPRFPSIHLSLTLSAPRYNSSCAVIHAPIGSPKVTSGRSILQFSVANTIAPTGVTQQLAIRGGKQCLDDALDTSFRQPGHLHVVTLPAALTITRVVGRTFGIRYCGLAK